MAAKTKQPQQVEAVEAQDDFDDFDDYSGGSATRYSVAVKDRIVSFIQTRRGGKVTTGILTPVVLSAEDAADRSITANTGWDYVEALRAALPDACDDGRVIGSKWDKREDGSKVLAIVPRKKKV